MSGAEVMSGDALQGNKTSTLTLDLVLSLVRAEVLKAQAKHKPMQSFHEGWAVIYEEFMHEMTAECFRQHISSPDLEEEAIQTAAMCVRFVLDLLRAQES